MTLLSGCAAHVPQDRVLPGIDQSRMAPADLSLAIPGLGPCTDSADRTLWLRAGQPVTVLVHGCFGSSGNFRSLAQVYAFQGQQAICFSYDDRASLLASSAQLRAALGTLSHNMQDKRVTVIGHSQGGLVARKALVADRSEPLPGTSMQIRLVTVSAPFAGIASARHCGSERARMWSLGIVPAICHIVTGSKWRDITYSSNFIRRPGRLVDQVEEHLDIVTDERNSCRAHDANGRCTADDFVFALEEQRSAPVETGGKVKLAEVEAGHVEIIGNGHAAPVKLIAILQQYGLLNATQASREAAFREFLAAAYLGAPPAERARLPLSGPQRVGAGARAREVDRSTPDRAGGGQVHGAR